MMLFVRINIAAKSIRSEGDHGNSDNNDTSGGGDEEGNKRNISRNFSKDLEMLTRKTEQ